MNEMKSGQLALYIYLCILYFTELHLNAEKDMYLPALMFRALGIIINS